ncbi:hypothetical protein AHF37_12482, partial [Paragonimus kellicotti]
GLFVGNPLTNRDTNVNSALYFLNYYGLADESAWNTALKECCGDECIRKCIFTDNTSSKCTNQVLPPNPLPPPYHILYIRYVVQFTQTVVSLRPPAHSICSTQICVN